MSQMKEKKKLDKIEESQKLEYSRRLFVCKICAKVIRNSNKVHHERTNYHKLILEVKDLLRNAGCY